MSDGMYISGIGEEVAVDVVIRRLAPVEEAA